MTSARIVELLYNHTQKFEFIFSYGTSCLHKFLFVVLIHFIIIQGVATLLLLFFLPIGRAWVVMLSLSPGADE